MSQKVLVVDDEIELCDLIAFQLSDEGYDVKQAYSLNEAMDVYSSFFPNVILSDMQMPGGTGIDLFKKLKEVYGEQICSFFIVSGFASMTEREILELGVQGLIKKPMRFEEILNTLKKHQPAC